jgi:putative acetyltransferase
VTVRVEEPTDVAAVRALHVAAFAPSRLEAEILDRLRADGDLVAPLSLVAVDAADGAIAGHVAISRAWVDDVEVLALGPIGVLPARQRAGVGSALMRAVLDAASATSAPLVALLGHADYYPRFGFESAGALGVTCPYPGVGPEHWMAYRLPAYDGSVRGAFRYADAFAVAE